MTRLEVATVTSRGSGLLLIITFAEQARIPLAAMCCAFVAQHLLCKF